MKVGRNDLCPCGSGKKYKKCCLLKEAEEHLSEVWGGNGESLETFRSMPPEDLVRSYVKAFLDQNFGLTYDLYQADSAFRKKKISKARYVSEMKTVFNPKNFNLKSSEILKSQTNDDQTEVLHKVTMAFGEEELTIVENYILHTSEGGWVIWGTQKKEFKTAEEVPAEIDFKDFVGLPIS